MGKKPNLVGQKFGRLTVTELYGTAKGHKQRWKCVCDCGGEAVVTTNNLTSGQVKSCGCYQKETIPGVATISLITERQKPFVAGKKHLGIVAG